MKNFLISAFFAALVLSSSAFAQEASPLTLRQRLEVLERRVELLEARSAAPSPSSWSCSANCGYYPPSAFYDGLVTRRVVGSGPTAASAFEHMNATCQHVLYLHRGPEPYGRLIEPTFTEVCVRD